MGIIMKLRGDGWLHGEVDTPGPPPVLRKDPNKALDSEAQPAVTSSPKMCTPIQVRKHQPRLHQQPREGRYR